MGLLIGDYEIGLGQSHGCPISDLDCLRSLSQVAAAAFCPFVAAASPACPARDRFAELERSANLGRTFDQPKYIPYARAAANRIRGSWGWSCRTS